MTKKSSDSTKKESPHKKQLKKSNITEKQVTEEIKSWNKSHPEITLIRFNTTGIPNGKDGFRTNSLKGAPDFIGVYMMAKIPVTFYFEIKSPTGTQRESQKKFEEASKKLGHHYFIIRSAQEAEDAIAKIHRTHSQKIGWSFLGIQDPYGQKNLSRTDLGKSAEPERTIS